MFVLPLFGMEKNIRSFEAHLNPDIGSLNEVS